MFAVLCTLFAIIAVICLWVMLYDSHRFIVVHHAFASDKIRKQVRMVMISDFHNCRYGKENEMVLAAIEKAAPDMIVIAGDMITADKKEKFDRTIHLLSKLKEKYPVYYAMGNHEQKISRCPEKYDGMWERFEKSLEEIGVSLLRNEHISFPDRGISLYGLEIGREYFQRFSTKPMQGEYLEHLLGKVDKNTYSVVLAHNPDYFPEYAEWGADLVLSGHVHGGIVRVPFLGGLISPAIRFFPKYDGGLFREKEATMVLGRGLGNHSPNVRLFNPAELLVIELRRK